MSLVKRGVEKTRMTTLEKIDYEAAKAWEVHREKKSTIDPQRDPVGFELERRSFEVGYLAAIIAILRNESNVVGKFKR